MAGIDIRARVGGVWRDDTLGSEEPGPALLLAVPPALFERVVALLGGIRPERYRILRAATVQELVAAERPDAALVSAAIPEAAAVAAQLTALGVPWLGVSDAESGGAPGHDAAGPEPADDARTADDPARAAGDGERGGEGGGRMEPSPLRVDRGAAGGASAARLAGAVGWLSAAEATSAALPWALRVALQRGRAPVDDDREHRMRLAGQVAASVAHELNNPLTYLLTNLEHVEARLVREGGALRDLAEAVSEAREAADRLAFITGELGKITRAPTASLGPVHPDRLFDSVIAIARPHLRRRAEVETRYDGLFPVRANEARLFQVLLNLVLNAAQAIEPGDPGRNRVTVGTRRHDGAVELFVRDTGSGIAPENLERIFEPFFTTRSARRGTGLGLSLCRRYVEEMGGRISVRSPVAAEAEAGAGRAAGAELRVELPIARGQRDRPTLVPEHDRRVARILVVDDERFIGRAFARALARHQVSVAESGEQALEVLEREGFDLVFTDLLMPGMSGIDLYRAIAARWPALAGRVVFLSGGALEPDAARFLDGIPNPRFQKPIGAQQLRDIVGGLLRPS